MDQSFSYGLLVPISLNGPALDPPLSRQHCGCQRCIGNVICFSSFIAPMNRTVNRCLGFLCLFIFLHFNIVAFRRHLAARLPDDISDSEDPERVDYHDTHQQAPPPVPVEQPPAHSHPKPPSKWCQYNECLKGRWVPRTPPFSNLEEFQEEFASRGSSPWHECPIPDPAQGEERSEEKAKALKAKRLVDMMNYVWQPERGRQVPWDPEDFLVRLLKTPAGIIFIGDSVTAGWQHAFNSYLEQGVSAEKGGIMFLEIKSFVNGEAAPGIRSFTLAPGHPKTLELQKLAGVPDSRMGAPVFTSIEDHMLLGIPDLVNITERNGAPPGKPWPLGFMKRVTGWEGYLQELIAPRAGEEGVVTGDSIVVMNTGPHWSRGTLSMLPELGSAFAEHRVLFQVYKDMIEIVIRNLSPMRRLTILYRATNAAHPHCTQKTKPYDGYHAALQGEADFIDQITDMAANPVDRKVRLRWDWDRFDVHNDLWRQAIPRLQREREEMKRKGEVAEAELPPKWLFVDFWPMSLQRPDAHSDCLHWCLPAIYNEWSRHILHILHLEAGFS
ncbi:hypothetical protein BKA70DRAFT_1330411 [Coprinopsis sp. MPI-PUGE-AT-0042]|nr:hypothetical protein BKA70DRAFT_1330411 [Coprinopsis sp. MPI-PUGE-AT-0042]